MKAGKRRKSDSVAENIRVLGRTALFRNLKADKLRELAALAQTRVLARGDVLFIAGERAHGLYAVLSGSIRAFRVNPAGKEQTLHIEGPGATLAEVPAFDDGPYPATAVAEEPSVVLFFDKRDVLGFLYQNPEIALAALKLLAGRLRQHAALADSLALRGVGQRLARLLLVEARAAGARSPAGLKVHLTFSNQQLADRVGSVREVVSRTLGRLEEDGLISVRGIAPGKKGRIVIIPDPAALDSYSGHD